MTHAKADTRSATATRKPIAAPQSPRVMKDRTSLVTPTIEIAAINIKDPSNTLRKKVRFLKNINAAPYVSANNRNTGAKLNAISIKNQRILRCPTFFNMALWLCSRGLNAGRSKQGVNDPFSVSVEEFILSEKVGYVARYYLFRIYK